MNAEESDSEGGRGEIGGEIDPTSPEAQRNYGTAEVSESGIDLSLLRHNLRLTPTERVEQMVAFVRAVLPLQGAARRAKQ
jgi:hypothetical protein